MNCGKFPYPTKKDALTQVNIRTKGRAKKRHGRPEYLRAYHCPDCNHWHITHTRLTHEKAKRRSAGR